MILQDAMPPYTMMCNLCQRAWEPPNARGKDHPTDASLDAAANKHFKECKGKPDA